MDTYKMCSSLMAIVTCLIGLQIGHVIVHFKVIIFLSPDGVSSMFEPSGKLVLRFQ